MKKIVLLGSTGSIGVQTLDIIRRSRGKMKITSMSAGSNFLLFAEQIKEFKPQTAAINNIEGYKKLKKLFPRLNLYCGEEGIKKAASVKSDVAVVALVGISGLVPTLAALDNTKLLALANKEALVVGGALVMDKAKKNNVKIIPIDSEHSAIYQCLGGEDAKKASRIILTSSGGPFRKYNLENFKKVTVEKALAHPTWNMGKKITIDSATLMNKGFEVLEAKWLFNMDLDKVEVVVHPQSIIHSMVEFIDSSVLAQMGLPDMKLPIAYAVNNEERHNLGLEKLNIAKVGTLTFEEPNYKLFPCLSYAYEAGRMGHSMPAVLNAANEVAVALFLDKKIKFLDIPRLIKRAMDEHKLIKNPSLEELLKVDRQTRELVKNSAG